MNDKVYSAIASLIDQSHVSKEPWMNRLNGIGKRESMLRVTSHDCRRAIHPVLLEGPLKGSVVGGMGHAL